MKPNSNNILVLAVFLMLTISKTYAFADLVAPSFLHQNTPSKVYKVIKGESHQKDENAYFYKLLVRVFDITADEYGSFQLEPIRFRDSQNNTLRLLNIPDALDVTHSMTSKAREQTFIAIPVPLLNGSFGKRRLLVTQENKTSFESMSEAELKKMIACQGEDWPDTKILKQNGYRVYGVTLYESNIKMLIGGRCDYFPRGINEIDSDLHKINKTYKNIVAVDSILLKYHAPVYFFVGKQNKLLAERVAKGLTELKANGEMSNLLIKNKIFNYNKSIELNPNLKIFHLSNTF